jgi:hypothetical protein
VIHTLHVPRPIRVICLGLAVCCLYALSVYHSHALGQYRTMYDNPIYRWRISIAVALSELHQPPLRGYVAYRSIADYLNQHGLALMDGEASPMPSYESVEKLIYDPNRLDALFRRASTIPVDYRLSPVPIVGSEKGEAAFYYWAFRLFGIHVTSLWYFYFLLLGVSVLAFFLTFWRQSLCILLLMLYLISHFYLVDVASTNIFQTIHNSRFLPVLAVLPSLHLLLLAARWTPPRLGVMILALCQTALLYFVIFGRLQASWQVAAILAVTVMTLPYRRLGPQPQNSYSSGTGLSEVTKASWPAILVVFGAVGLMAYEHVALDRTAYAHETASHTFWDPLLVGTVSASPELMQMYSMGQPPYSDAMAYTLAEHYLVIHRETQSPIAVTKDGNVVGLLAMRDMAIYDAVLKKVFFEILHAHPWLVIWSFLYQKPQAEITLVVRSGILDRGRIFLSSILLAIGSGILTVACGAKALRRGQSVSSISIAGAVTFLSFATVFVFPTIDIPDTIVVLLMVILTPFALVPLIGKSFVKRAPRFEPTSG